MQSQIGNDSESENEVENFTKVRIWSEGSLDVPVVPKLEIPFSVQSIISRIEQAQLLRAREDINMQLSDIMTNVHRIIARYTIVDFNLYTGKKSAYVEQKKTQRNSIMEQIAAFTSSLDNRQKILAYILAWLEEWNNILSEITVIDIDEYYHWIAQMELLPETLKTINNNVKILCRISTTFLEDQKRKKKKTQTRGTLWKSWKDRVIKRPGTAHALRPDQMISDQFATNTKISEIQDMLQELIGTAMFTKLESSALKYISSTIINLFKALNMVNDELKEVNSQIDIMHGSEAREKERILSLKMVQDLSEENEMLQQRLKDAEEKWDFIQSSINKGHLIHTQFSTSSTLKILPVYSSQSSMAKDGDMEDITDSILAKQFENIIDESQKKGIKGTGMKWDSGISYTAQEEITSDLIEQQYILPEKQRMSSQDITEDNILLKENDDDQKDRASKYVSQERKLTKGLHPSELSKSNLSIGKDEKKALEVKPRRHSEIQTLEKKEKETKPFSDDKSMLPIESKTQPSPSTEMKSQDDKREKGRMREKLRTSKPEYPPGKGLIPSKTKIEPTTESTDKDTKSEARSLKEHFRVTKTDFTSEPEKDEIKKEKHQIFWGTKEPKTKEKDILVLTKQVQSLQLAKSQSEMTKEAKISLTPQQAQAQGIASTSGKSEQSNLDLFQKAILAFLKEKIDNIGQPFDKKTVLKEEELLKKAEVEKLTVIKAKMEEYFQKVSETMTKILEQQKDIKMEGQVDGKSVKQTQKISVKPGSYLMKSPISAKSKISFSSEDRADSINKNLNQMILAEMEWERDVPTVLERTDHKEKEKYGQKKYLQEGQDKMSDMDSKLHMLKVTHLWNKSYKKEAKQAQEEEKQWQKKKVWKNQQEQRLQKQIEQGGKQTEPETKTGERRKSERQQVDTRKQETQETTVWKIQQAQRAMRHEKEKTSGKTEDEEKQKPGSGIENLRSSEQTTAKEELKDDNTGKMLGQSAITLSHRWKSASKEKFQLQTENTIPKTIQTSKDFSDSTPVSPSVSTQYIAKDFSLSELPLKAAITVTPEQEKGLGITLTPQQAQDLGITLTSQQAEDLEITLTPQQAKDLGITLTPQQAQDLGITLTPQQAQDLGITLTPQQAQAQRITLTPQQAQDLGITLTPQQAQDLGMTLTPQQAQAQMTTPTPQQAQDLGITLTPQQAQELGITLTPQQAQAQRITLTPQQAKDLGITLTSQQAKDLGITLTPQQAQDLGVTLTTQQAQAQRITLTPQQAEDLGITLTPQQAEDLGMTLTPQQVQAQRIILTPQQAKDLGITVTPQQAEDIGITLTPQQAQDLGITLTPQQAEDLGITLTPQQAQELGITLTAQRAQDLGITLTPQQAEDLGIALTPRQAQDLGIALTPQQAQAQRITLTPQQAQAQRITLTPQQAEDLGITLTPQQAEDLGIALTPQQAQDLGIALTPQQAQAQRITLTPQQAEDLGIALTPRQAQDLGIALTPQQAQAQRITLTPQQAEDLEIALTPRQAQDLGIALTPQQAQAQRITLTPQQAEDLEIALTPRQAQDLGIALTPQQAQAQRITLTPQQAEDLGITLTPRQAQDLEITLTPQQAKDLGITLTPQQTQDIGITLTPQQAQAERITLTHQQAQDLGFTLTPQQAQDLGITLTPQQAEDLGFTLTPQQAQDLGITLTPQQAKDLGVTLTPHQAQAQRMTLTPQQAEYLGITLTPQQAQAQRMTLTPLEAKDLGITLTPQQAQAQGITLTPQPTQVLGIHHIPQQAQDLGITFTSQQTPELAPAVTPQQAQDLGFILTPQQAPALGITLVPQQAHNLEILQIPQPVQAQGITCRPPLAHDLGIALTSQQAQGLGMITVTPEQAEALGITLTHEQTKAQEITVSPQHVHPLESTLTFQQAQAFSTPFNQEKLTTLAPISLRPLQKSKASRPTGQFIATKISPSPRLPLVSSAPIAEKTSIFGVSSPLQKLRLPPAQAPLAPESHIRMRLLESQILPTSRQLLVNNDQVISTEPVLPDASPIPGHCPVSWGPPTIEQSLASEALSSRHFFISRGILTAQPPLISQTRLTFSQPLIPKIPPSFGQSSRPWAALSPGWSLTPRTPSIPREQLTSRPLVFSQQPQEFQSSSTPQPIPSTLGQDLAPQALPEQVSSLRIPPTPRHSPTLWASPTPGKPRRVLPSSITQKRLAIISSLKSKSAVIHTRAPDFKVTKIPFTTKKFQISQMSDTSEETQILQDTFDMKPLDVTTCSTPVSQMPSIDEAVLPSLIRPTTSLPSLITQIPKTSQISLSKWDQKSRFPPIDQHWILTSFSGTKKPKIMVSPSSPKEIEEKGYFVDVEAQRKNLILLDQATKISGLPLQQYTTAKNLISEILHMDTIRLGYLFRKHIAYRLIQHARNNITKRLRAIQNTGRGYETQTLHTMLGRIDEYLKRRMQLWTEKQQSLEHRRNQCLKRMILEFSQLRDMYKLNLSQPSPLIIDQKRIPASTKFVQSPHLVPLIEEDKKSDVFKKSRQQNLMEAMWNSHLSISSYPITEKTSMHSLWAQLGGYPDVPRMLQLDIQSTFRKSLALIQSQ
ncbi:protein FAM186A [Ctenodactylus gundi]